MIGEAAFAKRLGALYQQVQPLCHDEQGGSYYSGTPKGTTRQNLLAGRG